MTTLAPRPGFDWSAVNWGGPYELRTECSEAMTRKRSQRRAAFVAAIFARGESARCVRGRRQGDTGILLVRGSGIPSA
jgi:hypothetical protein